MSFNLLINDLMGKLKANEHEYKNHLNTIWSIAQVTKPKEIKEKLQEYIYNVRSDFKDILLNNAELTVILSNLLNNAIEATSMIKKKELEVFIEDNKYYIIDVKNRTEGFKIEDLSNIFKIHYSTKGK